MQNHAFIEAEIVAIRGMRLMFEAGVEMSRQIWLEQAGYCDFLLLASPLHEGRYRWRVRFEDVESALEARGSRVLAADLSALIGDCLLEPLIWSIYIEAARGQMSDERPRPPARNAEPVLAGSSKR